MNTKFPFVQEMKLKLISIVFGLGETTFDKVKPEDSTLAYEELPIGIGQPYQILKCADARRNNEIEKGCGLQFRERKFAFETEAWAECRFKVMELTKVREIVICS